MNKKDAVRAILRMLVAAIVLSGAQAPLRLSAEELQRTEQDKPAAPASEKKAVPASGIIKEGDRLALARCIEIALTKSPNILAAESGVNASRSKVGQARANWYPQITLSGGYSRYSLITDPTDKTEQQYSGSATLTQSLFDFGKTWNQVTIQQKNLDAAREDRRDVLSTIVQNVKQAYYGLLQAEKNREVFAETVRQFEQHLDQAKGFFEAGVKSKFDVTKAEVDLSNAKLALIRAENAFRIARVTLNNAMGVPDAPEYSIEDTLSFQQYAITLDEAIQKAYANRPDLRALAARKEAADESVSLAQKGFFPTLSGNANYSRAEEHLPLRQDNWSAGVTLTFPLFNGFLTTYQVREAKENLNALTANEEALRQSILLEIQRAYLNLHEAEERVSTAELTVKQAQENLDIANGRYEAGVGGPIEVTDALVVFSNAKTTLIAALSDYKVAEATLIKAMGE